MAKQNIASSLPKAQSGVVRKSNMFLTGFAIVSGIAISFVSFILPPVAAAINHGIDRVTNGIKSKREMKARMEWYRPQIAKTLGMADPSKVTLNDFKTAAAMNPVLANALNDVKRDEAKENRNSALMNGAAAFIPGGEAVKEATAAVKFVAGAKTLGKQMAVTTTGGLLLDWKSKKHINAQEVAEGIASQYHAAMEQGADPRTVVTPQMVFLLRIAQDEKLAAEIEQQFGKGFQQMNEAEQTAVMAQYRPLADAVTSESYAVAKGMIPVQELMASAPNLKSNASKYAIGSTNASFVDNLNTQRQLAAQTQQGIAN